MSKTSLTLYAKWVKLDTRQERERQLATIICKTQSVKRGKERKIHHTDIRGERAGDEDSRDVKLRRRMAA